MSRTPLRGAVLAGVMVTPKAERAGVVRWPSGFDASLVAEALLGLVACSRGGDRAVHDLILRNAVVVDGGWRPPRSRTRDSAPRRWALGAVRVLLYRKSPWLVALGLRGECGAAQHEP